MLAVRLADRLHNVVTSGHFDTGRLQRLYLHTQQQVVPLAQALHLATLGAFLAGPPAQWHAVPSARFVPAVLALQRPWLGEAGRATDEAAACQGGHWLRLLVDIGGGPAMPPSARLGVIP